LKQVYSLPDCNAVWPIAIGFGTSDGAYPTGLVEYGSYYYMSGRTEDGKEPFIVKMMSDGSEVDKIAKYTDIYRIDDCQIHNSLLHCWAYASSYIGVVKIDPDDLSLDDGFFTYYKKAIRYQALMYPNMLRIDGSGNFYVIHTTKDNSDPSMGLIKFDSSEDVDYYVQYDDGGSLTYKYGSFGSCFTDSNLVLAGMTERSDGNLYSSIYGIDTSSGSADWGLGGDSNDDYYSWRDLVCDGETVYGVISDWTSYIYEHKTNRCQFTKVDTTSSTTRAAVTYASFSDNSLENCNIAEEDGTYLWSIIAVSKFTLSSNSNTRDILFLKLAKADFDLVDAYWMEVENDDRNIGFSDFMHDGTNLIFAGYTTSLGTIAKESS
jgi:hypothetical protein